MGTETTFETNLASADAVGMALDQIIAALMRRVERSGLCGRTVTLKVRYADFRQITRSMTVPEIITGAEEIRAVTQSLVAALPSIDPGIRLLGVTLSNLVANDLTAPVHQPSLPFDKSHNVGMEL